MIRTKRQDNSRRIYGINITPFTDICLVLLIIFMVTASALTQEASLNVELPKASTAEAAMPTSVTVRITRDQQLLVNKEPVTAAQLATRLKQFQAKYDTEVLVIEADEGVPYRLVISTIDTARQVGIAKFGLAVRQPENIE